jgi:hypothetical protein
MNELMQKLTDYHVALEAEKHLAEPANEVQSATYRRKLLGSAKNDPALI